jgi:hypothetical protein
MNLRLPVNHESPGRQPQSAGLSISGIQLPYRQTRWAMVGGEVNPAPEFVVPIYLLIGRLNG